ncbi:MAG: hypothetical protein EOP35_11585 [Rubrivivax sp.]|nr:MAG: hypothetical protein EOP35_11585 [Rubrivivax sp.]
MTNLDSTALLVNAVMRDLLGSINALCSRLQHPAAPLGPDEYDRLGLLLPAMLSAAEQLCRSADGAPAGDPATQAGGDAPTRYADLAQALVETRQLVKHLLEPLRPQMEEHADAIALIQRVSAQAASTRPNL